MSLLKQFCRPGIRYGGLRQRVVPPCRPNWAVQGVRQYGSQDYNSPGGPPQPGQETPEPSEDSPKQDKGEESYKNTLFKMFEAAATTFASIAVLG